MPRQSKKKTISVVWTICDQDRSDIFQGLKRQLVIKVLFQFYVCHSQAWPASADRFELGVI